jgi:O-antigen/teichoic acid export membrane protein
MDRRSFMLYVAKGVTMSTSFLIQLMIARMSGAEGFGVWSLFLNLSLIFTTIGDWGVTLNGPAMMLQANGQSWAASANYWRKRIAFFAGILMLLVIYSMYPKLAPVMVFGMSMVLGHGFLQDWHDRGLMRPDRASYRQMLQGLLQVSAVALVIYFKGSFEWVLGAYACMAALTYFIFYKKLAYSSEEKFSHRNWLGKQFPVLAGWALYYLTYNLPALLLGYLYQPAILGQYASHYFIYATVGTFSVITMDIFMAKTDDADRRFWLSLSSVLGMLMIACSSFYYPFIFGKKGFIWDSLLNIEMVILCGVLGLRLYFFNGLLPQGAIKAYCIWNGISFILHIVLITTGLLVFDTYEPWLAAVCLILAELFSLLLFSFKIKRKYVG